MAAQHNILRDLRLSQPEKLTQKNVADGAGISQGNYSKKERGGVAITLTDLEKLAKFYGLSIGEMFDGHISHSNREASDHGREGDKMTEKIIELTDVIVKLNQLINKKDTEIEKLKEELDRRSPK